MRSVLGASTSGRPGGSMIPSLGRCLVTSVFRGERIGTLPAHDQMVTNDHAAGDVVVLLAGHFVGDDVCPAGKRATARAAHRIGGRRLGEWRWLAVEECD